MAHLQTAAVGRRGRAWSSPRGNFMASYLGWPARDISEFPQISFVAALALYDVLNRYTDAPALKWPNDILCDGRKISGILLETVQFQARFGIVAGIGVNLAHTPPMSELEDRALAPVSLRELGADVAPETFLNELAYSFDARYRHWNAHGFAGVRDAWLARASGLGQRLTARLPDREHTGTFEDVSHNGSLVLRTKSQVLEIPAADIYDP